MDWGKPELNRIEYAVGKKTELNRKEYAWGGKT